MCAMGGDCVGVPLLCALAVKPGRRLPVTTHPRTWPVHHGRRLHPPCARPPRTPHLCAMGGVCLCMCATPRHTSLNTSTTARSDSLNPARCMAPIRVSGQKSLRTHARRVRGH